MRDLPAALRELPVRGPAVRDLSLPLPPDRMAPIRAGRPLKRWRYLGVYRSDLMLCVGHARVAGVPQRWWAVALPDGSLFEGSRGVELDARRASVRDVLELELTPPAAWRSPRRTGARTYGRLSSPRCRCAGACAPAGASSRSTAGTGSWTSRPATTRAARPGAGRRASGGPWTAARCPGTSWTASTTGP